MADPVTSRAANRAASQGADPGSGRGVMDETAGRMLDQLPTGVVLLGPDGAVRRSNRSARELLGPRIEGRPWRDVVSEAFVPGSDDEPDALLRDGRRVSISIAGLEDGAGQILELSDVSEARALEQRLHGLRWMADAGNLLGALAHQLRTPLAAALLDATSLAGAQGRCDESDPRARASARVLGRLVERLRDLGTRLDEMLVFARGGNLRVEPVDAMSVVEHAREATRELAAERGARVEMDVDGRVGAVLGSFEALAGAVENLVSNALQAGATRVAMLMEGDRTGDHVRIEVRDDGPGIPAAHARRIFEPLFTTRTGGNGLGLAIARGVVEAHGGALDLVDTGPDGTRFTLTLPAYRPGAGEESA